MKSFRLRWCVVIIILVMLSNTSLSLAREFYDLSIDLSEEEINWLEAHKKEEFKFYIINRDDIIIYDADTTPKGIMPKFVEIVNDFLNIQIKLIPCDNRMDLIDKMKLENVDGVMGLNDTIERSQYLNFTQPIMEIDYAYYSRGDSIDNVEHIDGKRLGFIKGDFIENYLEEYYPQMEIYSKYYVDVEDLERALGENEIDGYIIESSFDNKAKQATKQFIIKGIKANITVAVDRENKILGHIVDKIVEKLVVNDRFIEAIELEKKFYYKKNIIFSKAEKKIIDSSQPIVVGVVKNYSPYSYRNAEGVLEGIAIDLLKEFEYYTDIKFEYVEYEWSVLWDKFENGEIDLIAPIFKTENRDKRFYFSKPFGTEKTVLIGKKEAPLIENIEELKEYVLVLPKNYWVQEALVKLENRGFFIEAETEAELLDLINSNYANYTMESFSVAVNRLKTLKYDGLEIKGYLEMVKNQKFVSENLELIQIIDKILPIADGGLPENNFEDFVKEEIDYRNYFNVIIFLLVILFVLLYSLRCFKKDINVRKKNHKEMYCIKNQYKYMFYSMLEIVEKTVKGKESKKLKIDEMKVYTEICTKAYQVNHVIAKDIKKYIILADIGYVGVDDDLLNKHFQGGDLTAVENEAYRKHIEIGLKFIENLELGTIAQNIIHCHHERWDGKGYPRGQKGMEIPEEARIVTIVNGYYEYCVKYGHKKAIQLVVENKGKLYQPELVEILLANEKQLLNCHQVDRNEGDL